MKMKIPAYAKINLYLDVMERTTSGYHNIKSIMHSVSLCDYVSAEKKDGRGQSIAITCSNRSIPFGDENIVCKAAKMFFDTFSINEYDVLFHIEKNIPVSAGLAGGSTDAGAALMLLNELYHTGASRNALIEIGAKIGSDVPFCMTCGTALATGRGEILKKLQSDLELTFVIAKGGEGVSTPAAYGLLDEKYGNTLSEDFSSIDYMLRAIREGRAELISKGLYNVFESVILPFHKEASNAKDFMLKSGASSAMLSGSGPSVFGIFEDISNAEKVCTALKESGYDAVVCHSMNNLDYEIVL